MKKVKVLQIIGSSNLGGGENLLCDLLERMDKDRFEISLVCPSGGNILNSYARHAAEIKTLSVNRVWHLSALFGLYRYIKNGDFDLVHTHLYPSDLFGIIASRLAGIPIVITTIHGYNFTSAGIGLKAVKNFIFSLFYRGIYFFNDAVIAVCHAVKDDLTKRAGIKVKPAKVKVIYNGIDLAKTEDIDKNTSTELFKQLNGRSSLVGMVANFDPVKGHRNLIKAMPKIVREIPRMKVLFVGDGKQRKAIEKMAEKSDLSGHLIFAGTRRDILKIISLCRLIVLPSLFEGFSLVILEAMALGKAIVASNVGGIPEVLENGKTAKLIPPNSPEHLSEAMISLLKNESEASRMGSLGREKIRRDCRFHLRNMVAQTEELYLELLSSREKR